jgi:glyoxylase-like metal-dependent hydrolase (beta-lactamase superfamily II)
MATDATAPVAPGITAIDTVMAGQRELNAVYVISATEPCLVETGPGADHDRVVTGLDRLGISSADLAHVVVTHIHMDHAGGVGALLARYPRARVWVHEAGARHLVDPARLIASTARTYGEERMRTLYGDMIPSPADRVRAIGDGEDIVLGDHRLSVIHTPGHASHHIALHDSASGAMFTGEAIGSYLPWADCFRPALPPPEVDVEAALRSIQRMRGRSPTALLTSHFGAVPDPITSFDRASERVRGWAEQVRVILEEDSDLPEAVLVSALTDRARGEFEADAGARFDVGRYDVLGSIRMNAQGLSRYWRKRWEREVAERD